MVRYRRNRIPGGSYFFTVTLHDRHGHALTDHIGPLRRAFLNTQTRHPFAVDAIVILPDHLHTIWSLPPGDDDYPMRWRTLKALYTRALGRSGYRLPRHASGECALWQRRFWEHTVRDGPDYRRHVDYIHYNPVKHGYVARVADWPWSSFHRYVRRGLLPVEWAGGNGTWQGDFGE